MKLFKKNEKGTNSVKELLKKLKRHDTKVVAVAVIIALILSGGLIYISTPIVASSATEELAESEKQANQDTIDKLGEIGDYLNELDKVVTSNQESLNSINEKADNSEESNAINEKVSSIDTKLKEVHTNIDGTTTRIENLKTIIEKGGADNKEQIEKEFQEITKELASVKTQYEGAQQQIKDLMDKLQKEMDSSNKELGEKVTQNRKDILDQLSAMNKNMEDKNSKSLESFQGELTALGVTVNKQLENYNNDIRNNIEEVNTSVNNNINTINKNVGDGFGDLKAYIDTSMTGINTKLDSVFLRVSDGKKKLASTLLTFGVATNKDAKFNNIDDGIKELGNKMREVEGKLEAAEYSITPEKILAGQSVTINDKEITGTATSDATASAAQILAGETAYVNGASVIGGMVNHGPVTITLSNDNRSQTLEGGYYESIVVTTELPDIPAHVTYTHHVHSTESTDETVVDDSFASGSDYGTETNTSSGGCFDKPIYGICPGSGVANREEKGGYYKDEDGDGELDQNVFCVGNCTLCGARVVADEIGQTGKCSARRILEYKAGCGKVSGQIISAEVTF